jgi:RNA polymerase sigma factor (sigma-70 family)
MPILDTRLRDRMLLDNLDLIGAAMKRLRTPPHADREDLWGALVVAAMSVIEAWKPGPRSLRTDLGRRLRWAALDWVRKVAPMTRAMAHGADPPRGKRGRRQAPVRFGPAEGEVSDVEDAKHPRLEDLCAGTEARRALKRLRPNERLALNVVLFAGMTQQQAGELMGVSGVTVGRYVRRGLEKLRAKEWRDGKREL